MGLYLLRLQVPVPVSTWKEGTSFMAHISKPGNFSGLAPQHFETGPLPKILFPKGRKSAEGKACANSQRMAKSPGQKG